MDISIFVVSSTPNQMVPGSLGFYSPSLSGVTKSSYRETELITSSLNFRVCEFFVGLFFRDYKSPFLFFSHPSVIGIMIFFESPLIITRAVSFKVRLFLLVMISVPFSFFCRRLKIFVSVPRNTFCREVPKRETFLSFRIQPSNISKRSKIGFLKKWTIQSTPSSGGVGVAVTKTISNLAMQGNQPTRWAHTPEMCVQIVPLLFYICGFLASNNCFFKNRCRRV